MKMGSEVQGSEVQRFRGSGFRGSKIQRFKGLKAQDSMFDVHLLKQP
jgi:hypothetical protein